MKKNRARPRPQRRTFEPEPSSPHVPPPPRPKPVYYRLVAEVAGLAEPVVLIPKGPLGLCQDRGMSLANYGGFFETGPGRRVWAKPMTVAIELVEETE